MSLSKIRLELARDHDFPDGSRDRGYEYTAPLADDGRISEGHWETDRARCRVRRFWSGEADGVGHLIRKPGGSWAFHYDLLGDPDRLGDVVHLEAPTECATEELVVHHDLLQR